MKHLFEVLALVWSLGCLASGKTFLDAGDLFYECTHNDTIVITGNITNKYGSIYAVEDHENGSTCNVNKQLSADSSKVEFTISSCNVSSPITVYVMQENQTTDEMMVLGGEELRVYNLKCTDIRKGGTDLNKTIALNEGIEPTAEVHHQTVANLSMEIKKANGRLIPSSSTVLIGEQLSIVISVNSSYKLNVRSCIAWETKNVNHTKRLINDGKTEDQFLISDFSSMTKSLDQLDMISINATLYAFRFRGSHEISIACTINVCEDNDDTCPIQNGNGRKRRAVTTKPYTETLQSRFIVLDSKRNHDGLETSGAYTDSKPLQFFLTLCALLSIFKFWI